MISEGRDFIFGDIFHLRYATVPSLTVPQSPLHGLSVMMMTSLLSSMKVSARVTGEGDPELASAAQYESELPHVLVGERSVKNNTKQNRTK